MKDGLSEAPGTDWSSFRTRRDLGPSLTAASTACATLAVLTACATGIERRVLSGRSAYRNRYRSQSTYAPDKATLVVVELFWAGLAAVMGLRLWAMAKVVKAGHQKCEKLPDD